ncbi:isopentenyl-diphosphate Delta-isomerase [Streptomyces sp. T-3]|nr:isopentenyl-diphosphate Delta-isomerase [Streptomyces sp. T-3]
MLEADDERIVLLDDDWEAIGHAPKLATHHSNTPLHLAFTCYAFDSEGRFLLTRRAWAKKTWPGVWTNSCCGHLAPEETLHSAVSRRLQAELGVTAARMDVVLDAVRYRAVMDNGIVENEVGPAVRVLLQGPVDPNPYEVAEITWLPWTRLVDAVTDGTQSISPWSVVTIEKLTALGANPWQWPVVPPRNWLVPLRTAEMRTQLEGTP